MSAFNFRLEKVWKHRRTVVDEHSVAVARINRQVAKLSRQVVELDRTIAHQARALIPAAGESRQPRDLVSGSDWLEHLHKLREELDGQLQQAVKDLERSRSRLTVSWRDLEILSQLRDRHFATWRADHEKRLRKEMDEIGQVRAFRHRGTKDSR